MTGKIARLTAKGYGFINVDDDGPPNSVFFHAKDMTNKRFDDLHVGDEVLFQLERTPKGCAAKLVEVVS